MSDDLRIASKRLVGAKQVLRGIEAGKVGYVYIARDADPFVTRPVMVACEKSGIRFEEAESMKTLGSICGIEVKAAVAALLK